MSRYDQYIGLTVDAIKFLSYLVELENGTRSKIVLCDEDETLCRQIIHGSKVIVPKSDPNLKSVYVEVCQHTIWSNGPMYFTCIQHFLHKTSGQIIDMGRMFEWTRNPLIEYEFDRDLGYFNV